LDTTTLTSEQLERVLFSLFGLDILADPQVRRALLETLDEDTLRALAGEAGLDPSGRKYDLAVDLSLKSWTTGVAWVRQLAQILGIADEFLARKGQKELPVEVVAPFVPPPDLFDYQVELAGRIAAALSLGQPQRFLVQLPTGAGKTRVMMEAIAQHLNTRSGEMPKTIFWLAHTEELCDQAVESFLRVWEARGTYEIRLGRLWGAFRPSVSDLIGGLVVASYQKSIAWSQDLGSGFDRLAAGCGLVVVDEAHKVLAPSIRGLLEYFERLGPPCTVGLTATPGRGSEDPAGNLALARFFSGHLFSAPSLGDSPILALQRRGILAQVDRREVRTGVSMQQMSAGAAGDEPTEDLPSWVLSALARNQDRNELICSLVCEAVKDGLPTLVFCCTVDHAKTLAVMTAVRGLRTGYIDYTMGRSARGRLVQSFRSGQLDALFNFGVLSTGFDAPNVGCVVIARPTTSIVLYSQMIGRGLRGERVGGSPSFRLIDVRDNLHAFGNLEDVYAHFSSYWLRMQG
jgi:superfamily II DNA or RNA helicase